MCRRRRTRHADPAMASKSRRPTKTRAGSVTTGTSERSPQRSSRALRQASARARERALRPRALTPLARTLHEPKQRPGPLDALKLASKKWADGERLDIGQIANELGVARATVFRWVGSRELLYGEVLSRAYALQRGQLERSAKGRGIERILYVARRNLHSMAESPALRKFIEHDPEFAIRVLTSKSSPVQARTIELEVAFLRECLKDEKVKPRLDLDTLAYIIIRIGEAFLYADVISGRKPEIDKAVAAIRILLSGARPVRPKLRSRAPSR